MLKSQPCGRRSARLIRAATMSRSHGGLMPSASSRWRQVRTVRCDSLVSRTSVANRRERARAVGPGVVSQADEHEHALDGCQSRSAGTGAWLSAHEIASTLTADCLEPAQPRHLLGLANLCPIRVRDAPPPTRFRWSTPDSATPSGAVSAGSNPVGGTDQRHKFEHFDNLGPSSEGNGRRRLTSPVAGSR
jgi:hypothetical protein